MKIYTKYIYKVEQLFSWNNDSIKLYSVFLLEDEGKNSLGLEAMMEKFTFQKRVTLAGWKFKNGMYNEQCVFEKYNNKSNND